jgi:hypothetical protein
MLATLLSSSSSISGLPSDSDEDIVKKQQDVPKPQRLVSIIAGNLQINVEIFVRKLCKE